MCCVPSARDKLPFLLSVEHTHEHCHLLIDDFSGGQERADSYILLYDDILDGIIKKSINFEFFIKTNDWPRIVYKYLNVKLEELK